MNHENEKVEPVEQEAKKEEYEAPAVESVMTPQDLEREVQYAGQPVTNLG